MIDIDCDELTCPGCGNPVMECEDDKPAIGNDFCCSDCKHTFGVKTMTTPKSIIVHGRRWFQKSSGSTYHTAQIFLDGRLAATTDIRWGGHGYDDQYLWTAFEELEAGEHIQLVCPPDTKNRRTESPQAYCKRVGCRLEYFATEVGRRKDL